MSKSISEILSSTSTKLRSFRFYEFFYKTQTQDTTTRDTEESNTQNTNEGNNTPNTNNTKPPEDKNKDSVNSSKPEEQSSSITENESRISSFMSLKNSISTEKNSKERNSSKERQNTKETMSGQENSNTFPLENAKTDEALTGENNQEHKELTSRPKSRSNTSQLVDIENRLNSLETSLGAADSEYGIVTENKSNATLEAGHDNKGETNS
uniref:Uncharacterized protein n=1 Tax=Cacopsylla melanoneura TaxID=428564 RepID=A0A8D8ZD60_9HEMI